MTATSDVLEELLVAWRASPHVELADRIVKLGALCSAVVDKKTWFEVAARRVDSELSSLLAIAADGVSAVVAARVEMLATWPADPRIDRFVAGLYVKPPFEPARTRPFWLRLQPLASRVRDERAWESLQNAQREDTFLDRVLLDIGELEETSLDPELSARLVEVDATVLVPSLSTRDELLARVLESPHDPTLREVLRDVLLEEGHPRGALMARQVDDEAAFIKKHAEALLGPLARVIRPVPVFRDGFLSRAALKQRGSSASTTAGNQRWATVEHLEGPGDVEIITHPVMRSLRSLRATSARIDQLRELPLVSLTAFTLDYPSALLLADASVLPELNELHVIDSGTSVSLLLPRVPLLRVFRVDFIDIVPRQAVKFIEQLLEVGGDDFSVGFFEGALVCRFVRVDGVLSATLPTDHHESDFLKQLVQSLGVIVIE